MGMTVRGVWCLHLVDSSRRACLARKQYICVTPVTPCHFTASHCVLAASEGGGHALFDDQGEPEDIGEALVDVRLLTQLASQRAARRAARWRAAGDADEDGPLGPGAHNDASSSTPGDSLGSSRRSSTCGTSGGSEGIVGEDEEALVEDVRFGDESAPGRWVWFMGVDHALGRPVRA